MSAPLGKPDTLTLKKANDQKTFKKILRHYLVVIYKLNIKKLLGFLLFLLTKTTHMINHNGNMKRFVFLRARLETVTLTTRVKLYTN